MITIKKIDFDLFEVYEAGVVKGTIKLTINKGDFYVSYLIFPQYRNKGIAETAVTMFIDMFFNDYHIEKLYAIVNKDNELSIKVLTAAGFEIKDDNIPPHHVLYVKHKQDTN